MCWVAAIGSFHTFRETRDRTRFKYTIHLHLEKCIKNMCDLFCRVVPENYVLSEHSRYTALIEWILSTRRLYSSIAIMFRLDLIPDLLQCYEYGNSFQSLVECWPLGVFLEYCMKRLKLRYCSFVRSKRFLIKY